MSIFPALANWLVFMHIDLFSYESFELLNAMTDAINTCRKGWNFNGKIEKANELQRLCENYEASKDIDWVKKFISLASEPRALFTFTLFKIKFEFGKTNIGNTRSSKRFNYILSQAKRRLDITSCDSSYQNKDLMEKSYHTILTMPQRRRYPPVGLMDTIMSGSEGYQSIHGKAICFPDEEIVEKLHAVKTIDIQGDDEHHSYEASASYTKHGKAIIQQQATRGCTAAAAAMLIVDCNGKPNLQELFTRNLGNTVDIIRDIKAAGFTPITTQLQGGLVELREKLLLNGSAAINIIDPVAGGHEIVVDEVSEDLSKVRVRDPYHGWEITITADAFLRRIRGETTLIQIELSAGLLPKQSSGEDMSIGVSPACSRF